MLSPRLREVKIRIENKPSLLRTKKEEELLIELTYLDRFLDIKKDVSFKALMESLSARITSGSEGVCPCCGKKL